MGRGGGGERSVCRGASGHFSGGRQPRPPSHSECDLVRARVVASVVRHGDAAHGEAEGGRARTQQHRDAPVQRREARRLCEGASELDEQGLGAGQGGGGGVLRHSYGDVPPPPPVPHLHAHFDDDDGVEGPRAVPARVHVPVVRQGARVELVEDLTAEQGVRRHSLSRAFALARACAPA